MTIARLYQKKMMKKVWMTTIKVKLFWLVANYRGIPTFSVLSIVELSDRLNEVVIYILIKEEIYLDFPRCLGAEDIPFI